MNQIQKAWIKLLKPVIYLVNEKMAKRGGLIGKFGRFFQFGPREFGYHPTNRFIILMNRQVLMVQAFMIHRYSYFKTLTHNGYHLIRPFKGVNFIGPLMALSFMAVFSFTGFGGQFGYGPDRLTSLKNRIGRDAGIPLNSLNHRVSAHYMEINKIYGVLMLKEYSKIKKQIVKERDQCSIHEKKTRYADPSYEYIPMTPSKRNMPNTEQALGIFE